MGDITTDANGHSGSYTSVEWKSLSSKNQIKFYMPTMGNPLLEEKGNKNYSFEVAKADKPKVCGH